MPKIFLLVIFLCVSVLALSSVKRTFSFFYDDQNTESSSFGAGRFDFLLNKNDFGDISLDEEIILKALSSGTLPLKYQFKVETDDSEFCDHLSLTAKLGDNFFSGPLNNFYSTTTIAESAGDEWRLEITDPFNALIGDSCSINFIFHAWQPTNQFYDPAFGFVDVELASGRVLSGGIGGPDCITVTEPNGGEVWWVGRMHKMAWFTSEPNGADDDLLIDLFYSNNSGQSWALIKKDLPNNSAYIWRVSLLLENNTYWVPSGTARVKAVAHYTDGQVCGWDMSDEDYCPPIEYDLLTAEELAWLAAHDLLDEAGSSVPPEAPADVAPGVENGFPDEEIKDVSAPVIGESRDINLTPPAVEINYEDIKKNGEASQREGAVNGEIAELIILAEPWETNLSFLEASEAQTGEIIIGEIIVAENKALKIPEPSAWAAEEQISSVEEIIIVPAAAGESLAAEESVDETEAGGSTKELEIIINDQEVTLIVNEF